MKFNVQLVWVSAIFVLLLAISFAIIPLKYSNLRSLKSILLSNPLKSRSCLKEFLGSLSAKPLEIRARSSSFTSTFCILWMAPFLSGGGYSSEAWSYVTALDGILGDSIFRLKIEQHGDLENLEFWNGLPEKTRTLGNKLYSEKCRMNETIVLCHSEPGAWFPPLFQTLPCPPTGYDDPLYTIGRTMFETDRLTPEHVKRCNRMDSIWVPTDFHVSTFVQSGVDRSKIVKMVQSVDVDFFDPSKYEKSDLSKGRLLLGSDQKSNLNVPSKNFVFLSVFKWETRKGWDILLNSFLKEFSREDGVALYLLTNPYHSERNFDKKIMEFINDSNLQEPSNGWAQVYLIDGHIDQIDLPKVYKAADAFVLPTRGEGWGRPLVEAMSMSLPVIATNWSGPTEYLTEENGYPLPVHSTIEVTEGPFKGHHFANPSVNDLRVLMRYVVQNPFEAAVKGKNARVDMIRRFSPEIVADLVVKELEKIIKMKN